MMLDKDLENLIQTVLETMQLNHYFLVELILNKKNNFIILLDADAPGINIIDLARINRKLRTEIDFKNWFKDGDYSLEVSSAGIDNPLKLIRQYKKNIGRKVEITFLDNSIKTGILENVVDEEMFLKENVSKKETKTNVYLYHQIKHTYVQIQF